MKQLRPVFFAVLFSLPAVVGARAALACSGGSSAGTSAFPSTGATDVSPQSSIFLISGVDEVPPGLTLFANGSAAPAPVVTSLGRGVTAAGLGSFFRLGGSLEPSTDYVVDVPGSDGGAVALTHFSTAASYDKTMGVAPSIDSLRLWRVHYAPDRVRAGGCVFSEYEGYFALDFTPASVPGTPSDEVVSVLTLSSDQLGTTQTFAFNGVTALPGGFVPSLAGDGVTLPDGGALSAAAALWKPNLEPGRTFCATITAYGRNDLAAPVLQSPSVCATVAGIETVSGAGAATGVAGAGGRGGAGGTGTAGAGGNVGAGGAAGEALGTGGTSPIGVCGIGVPGPCLGNDMVRTEGCHCTAAPEGGSGAAAPFIVALALVGLRARRARRARSDV